MRAAQLEEVLQAQKDDEDEELAPAARKFWQAGSQVAAALGVSGDHTHLLVNGRVSVLQLLARWY